MSWITPEDVEAVYPDTTVTQPFLDHLQSLAEVCTGIQETPISAHLKAAFIEVAQRKSLAGDHNPQGLTSETLGSYSYQQPGAPGLGLTKAECRSLKRAVGKSGLSAIAITRGEVETPPIHHDDILEGL